MRKMFYLFLLLSLSACFEQERNCSNFKNGKFRFDFEINGVQKSSFFERNDSLEIATFETKKDTSTIRWINDCECVLQKKRPKNIEEKKAILIKILSTRKKSITFEFGYIGSSNKQIGTAIKL